MPKDLTKGYLRCYICAVIAYGHTVTTITNHLIYNTMDNTTNGVVGASTPPAPQKERKKCVIGPSFTQILNVRNGKADISTLTPEEREWYEDIRPKYDPKEISERFERDALYRQVQPHLIDVEAEIPDPVPILSRYGTTIASEGNISAVVGAAKSKKTFLCTALVGAMLNEEGSIAPFAITPRNVNVLWVDTEQSQVHAQRVAKRILRLAKRDENSPCEALKMLTLREIEPKERMQIVENSIKLFRPKLVVVDGISDLMYNSNCIEESDAVVGRIMALSTEYKCHIMNVLHTNPNSDKARGHIGSTLQRKVETMIYVHKVGECSVVEPQFCRNEEFSPFAFTIGDEGLPEECGMPNEGSNTDLCVQVMQEHFPNGVERSVLTNKLIESCDISRVLAKVKITRAISRGLLLVEGEILRLADS